MPPTESVNYLNHFHATSLPTLRSLVLQVEAHEIHLTCSPTLSPTRSLCLKSNILASIVPMLRSRTLFALEIRSSLHLIDLPPIPRVQTRTFHTCIVSMVASSSKPCMGAHQCNIKEKEHARDLWQHVHIFCAQTAGPYARPLRCLSGGR